MQPYPVRTGEAQTRAAGRFVAPIWAILIGAFILVGAGFAQPSLLHNAAHDARHAFAFPCH